ncbi:MAG: methyl-accepting chemotaxis protein [Arcobacter sp.]|uniref:methyl-accepting chemotaxis protein n=1 Tax=Arcobacter sp. TaxID=1872629 RepID=UPI003C711362
MKNITIRTKLLGVIVFSIVIVAGLIAIESIYSLNSLTKGNIALYKKSAYEVKEKELKSYVKFARDVVEKQYQELLSAKNNNQIGDNLDNITKELKQKALETIKSMRYGKNGNGYFFIYDYNGNNVMHPIKPQNVGKNFMKSAHIRDLIILAKKDGGLVKYNFIKPNDKKLYEKLGYGIGFDEWQWMIGTGAYTDEIDAHIEKMRKEANKNIISTSWIILTIALIVSVFITIFVMYFVNKQINRPLSSFQNGLLNFFSYLNKETKSVERIVITNKDEIGVMANIVNENIEKTKLLIEQDEEVINNVKNIVKDVNSGDLSTRVTRKTDNEGLEELKNIFNIMLDSISNKIHHNLNEVDEVLNELKNMNFTHRIKNADGKVAQALNSLADTINEMLIHNMNNGLDLEDSAKELLKNVATLSTSSNESAASLEETAAAIEEITSNITASTQNILEMVSFANKVSESAKDGEELANKTSLSMDSINTQVVAISEAITVVDQIAFQTNILSLNAAVEAATAGEAGKGFAVVAAEVRNLASRSAEAAKEIKGLVEKATIKANEGKTISTEMIKGYFELKNNITQTLGLIENVEVSSKEQKFGIEQINNAITSLDQQTQKNASVANLSNEIAQKTQKIASKILEEVEEKSFIGKK